MGFGMFIHYGLYSQLGRGEWVQHIEKIPKEEYIKLAETFTAENFDAERIARAAKAAGAKYATLTTRHHEGFSLFDFSRTHSMAQRYEAGKEFKELLIGNYDLYERERAKPAQLTLFNVYGDAFDDECYDYEKILKECIIQCKIRR